MLVVDAQGRLVDFDGDDLSGVAEPDLDALADDLGAAGQETVRCTRMGC
ncbi:MAG: hypothetical protein M3319_05670 [Actinomycetota bacterium]|nr:hypothetical protein [Actinomycetota bacterium]MDQ3899945.1 hypothetical protein [Actinomycetota bacterium]